MLIKKSIRLSKEELSILQLSLVNIEDNLEIDRDTYKKVKSKIDLALYKLIIQIDMTYE